MLDTHICSFLSGKKPEYLLERLQNQVLLGHQIVVSAITYAELTFGAVSRRASPKMLGIVREFIDRLDDAVAWDKHAVEFSGEVKKSLESRGEPIGHNYILIAGHAIALSATLVTDNVREFSRVDGLQFEDWVQR